MRLRNTEVFRRVAYQLLIAANELTEEQLKGLDFDVIVKNAVSLTKAIAYKRNIDVKNRSIYESGQNEYLAALYEAMANENPKLYRELKAFIKAQKKVKE